CQPPLAIGQPCTSDPDCGATSWCDTTSSPSVCTALPGIGRPCSATSRCAAGSSCSLGSCVANLLRNMRCGVDTAACADGLSCAGSRCGDPPLRGGDCSVDMRCGASTVCEQGRCHAIGH